MTVGVSPLSVDFFNLVEPNERENAYYMGKNF